MKISVQFLTTLACATLVWISSVQAGTHVWNGAMNNSWNNAGNWSSGGAPQVGELNVILVFPPGAVRTEATNGINNFPVDDIVITGNNYTIGGYPIILTGASYYNLECGGSYNAIALDMNLNNSLEYFNITNGILTLSGKLSGIGGFTKFGAGNLSLSGPATNTYASPTSVRGGYLHLNKPANVTAVPGALTIGVTNSANSDSYVALQADQQIADSAIPTVNPTGVLQLNGYNETVAGLNIQGGYINTGLGHLTLKGNVDARAYFYNNATAIPTISGFLSLGGAERTFHVDGGFDSQLDVSAYIEDGGNGAGLIKTGDGGLRLGSMNSYAGTTKINEGHLRVSPASSLGTSAAGTIVAAGANLTLEAGTAVGAEPLTLSGNGDGPDGALQLGDNASTGGLIILAANTRIGVNDSNAVAVLNSTITGPGALHKVGPGALTLSGTVPNNYVGSTYVDEGTLRLGKIGWVSAIPGNLYIGLTNGANSSTNRVQLLAPGQIEDFCSVFMQTNGRFDLNGYPETISNLTMTASALMNTKDLLTLKGDANLDSASDIYIDIGGSAASGKYDRLKVTGSVNLGNATLHLTQSGIPNINDQFVLIDNDGVDTINGTFKGLPENALLKIGGSTFKISYASGDGNDVGLTLISNSDSPAIGPVTRLGNGQIQLNGSGIPGLLYTIEAAENVANPNGWQIIGTAVADGNGLIQFVDSDAPNHSMRFYRFRAP